MRLTSRDSTPFPQRSLLDKVLGPVTPWVILAVGLATSIYAWRLLSTQEQTESRARLDSALIQTKEGVDRRLQDQIQVLHAAADLVMARPKLSPEEWSTFVANQELSRHAPAIVAMGFVPQESLISKASIFLPEGLSEKLGDPIGLLARPEIRDILELGRDIGGPSVSSRVALRASEGKEGRGFLLSLPIYFHYPPPPSLEERRASYRGSVFCLIDSEAHFSGIFGARPIPGLDVEIYDSPEPSEAGLIYDRTEGRLFMGLKEEKPWTRRTSLEVAGRRWLLCLAFPPTAQDAAPKASRTVAIRGGLLTLLCFLLALFLARERRRLLALSERLRESEDGFRAVAETASCAIIIHSQDRIEYANQSALRITHYSMEEMIGMNQYELTHPEDRAMVMSRGEARWRGEEAPTRYEFRTLTKEGEVRWVDFAAGAIHFGNRQLGLITAFDITERVQANEARLGMERKLLEAQKLESIGLLAGGVAHDFNNLLAVIQGNAEILKDHAREGAENEELRRACLKNIEDTCKRAADLVSQMLAYSGRGRFVTRSLDLNRELENIAQLLRVTLSKKVELCFQLQEPLSPIEADSAQIQQVVINLVTNAAEAIEQAQGRITLRSGETEIAVHAERDGELATAEMKRMAFFEVEDTGVGMDAATLERIFDPFFTTKFTGRGLGLAAIQGIVRGHGGSIEVQSELGKGTCFRVCLPLGAHDALASVEFSNDPKISLEDWKGEGLVLVADDEYGIREVAGAILERAGFQIIQAADGVEAMELFHAHQDQLALVLLDFTMPRMGGEEAFRQMHESRASIPVILCSGYGRQDAIAGVDQSLLAGFLPKPFTAEQLLDRVRTALRK
jgi:two-component system, cell cycle sensor histidine kinase and response regulator CckA